MDNGTVMTGKEHGDGSEIKLIPFRQGERFSSFIPNTNASKILNFKSTIDIKTYIDDFISKKK